MVKRSKSKAAKQSSSKAPKAEAQKTRRCYKCKRYHELKYFKRSYKTGNLCVNCNMCRLKQNSYIQKHNKSEKAQARVHRKKGEGVHRKRTDKRYDVRNRKSEVVLLCQSCNDKIGHIVYKDYV